MRDNPVALLDLDGTVADYRGALLRDLDKLRSPEETDPIIPPRDDEPDHYIERVKLIRQRPGWWQELEPLSLGFEILQILKDLGFEVHVLTKGPWKSNNAWTEKIEWCKEHLPDIPVTITQDKGLVYGRVLVDDWPPYIQAWLEWRPRGLVIMPDRPWNQGFSSKRVIRYDGSEQSQVLARVFLKRAAERNGGEPMVVR